MTRKPKVQAPEELALAAAKAGYAEEVFWGPVEIIDNGRKLSVSASIAGRVVRVKKYIYDGDIVAAARLAGRNLAGMA